MILGAYIWGEKPALRFQAMSPEARLAAAIAEGGQVHPGYAEEIEAGVSRAWGKAPFQKGAWPEADEAPDALQRPGRAGPLRRRPDERAAGLAGGRGAVRACRGRGDRGAGGGEVRGVCRRRGTDGARQRGPKGCHAGLVSGNKR